MASMTVVPARLSKEGDRVLCGWKDALTDRYGCDGTIGWIVDGGRDIAFQPFYRQARPVNPNEPLALEIDKMAKDR